MAIQKQILLKDLPNRLNNIIEDVVEGGVPASLDSHYIHIIADTELYKDASKEMVESTIAHLEKIYGSLIHFDWINASNPCNIGGLHGFPLIFIVQKDSVPRQALLTMKGCCSSPNSCVLETV